MEFDASAIFNEDGSFTDAGRQAMISYAGEEHKDTKLFDDVKDFPGVCKRLADTKSSHDKKLENVIQKPADDASDEVKAAYRAQLAEASGAPKTATEYEFYKSEKLPDGMERSQELEDKMRTILFEHKAPKTLVLALSQAFEEFQIGSFNAIIETDRQTAATAADEKQGAFDTACTAMKEKYPGEKLATEARIGLLVINKYGTEELVKKLKDANMYENAADLTKWRDSGVPLETLQFMIKVGHETLDAKFLGNPPSGPAEKSSMYARTKAQLGEK